MKPLLPSSPDSWVGRWIGGINDFAVGMLAALVFSFLSFVMVDRYGVPGLVFLSMAFLGVILALILIFRFPVTIALLWFVCMSGLNTLVMLRMPGLPDFSFSRAFFTIMIFMIPVFSLLGKPAVKAPYLPDLLLVLFTIYVLVNLSLWGDSLRFNLWLTSNLSPMVAYFFAKQFVESEGQIRNIFIAFMIMTVYFWFTSIGENFEMEAMVWPHYILDRDVGKSWFGRSRGPFLQPALFGQILGMYLMVHLFVITRKMSGFWKFLIGLNLVLGGVGLLFTYTRGGWLATGIGIIFLAAIRSTYRKILITMTILAVVLGTLGVLSPKEDEFLEERFENKDTIENRLGFLAASIRMIEEKPLLGIGYFRFEELRHLYVQGTNIPFYGYVKRKAGENVAIHDIYIGRAAEEGLVGLCLFLSFFAVMAREYLNRWREDPKGKWFNRDSIALMAGLTVAYFVGGLAIDYRYFDNVNVIPYFFAGVIAGFPRSEIP